MAMWELLCVMLVGLATIQMNAGAPVTDENGSTLSTDSDAASSTAESTTEAPTEGSTEEYSEANSTLPWQNSGHFEGDIVLPAKRNGIQGSEYRWPSNTMPYYIDPIFSPDQRSIIESAIKEINDRTCVSLRPTGSTEANWVHINDERSGCFSDVGKRGWRQLLNLNRADGCVNIPGTAIHELVHALGFWHQQSTTDRDDYVRILWDNIDENNKHNFNKYSAAEVTAFGQPYDYGSIMHYSANAFSKNGQPTIQPLLANVEIGQSRALSDIDIRKINLMYNC